MRFWVLDRFGDYARTSLALALFLSPVIFHQATADVFNLVKLTVLWTLGLCAVALFVIWSAERDVWPPRLRLFVPAGAFLGALALATVFSQSRGLSLLGGYHRYGGLLPYLLYAAIALAVAGLYWERPEGLRSVAVACSAASALTAGYVVLQALGLDWISWKDSSGRPPEFPVGTLGNSNFSGGYLGIAAPLVVWVALSARRDLWRTAWLGVLGAGGVALWLTQTRGGMLAVLAGLGAMGFAVRGRLPRWAPAAAGAAAALGVALVVLVVWHPGSKGPPGPLARIGALRTDTLEIRRWYWGAAWRLFLDRPLLGSGPDTFSLFYPRHRSPADGAHLGLTITDKPHSVFLEHAAGAGVLGAAAYLALAGLALATAYRHCRRAPPADRLLPAAFLGVLAGYLAQAAVSIDVPPLAVMGWVALGGIGAIADPSAVGARQAMETARRPGRKRKAAAPAWPPVAREGPLRWPIHAAAAIAAGLVLAAGVRPYLADMEAKSAGRGRSLEAIEAGYRRTARLNPLEPAYRTGPGARAEGRADTVSEKDEKARLLRRALSHYREALRLQPGNVFFTLNAARATTTLAADVDPSRFPEADGWWRRVAAIDPTDWEIHRRHGRMLEAWAKATGDSEAARRAAETFDRVARLRPQDASAWVDLARARRALGEEQASRQAAERALAAEPGNAEVRDLLDAP